MKTVRFIRMNRPVARAPVLCEPGIVIVVQGKMIGYLGDQVYPFDPFNYLILSVPMPIECETLAMPDEPFLAISVAVAPVTVGELLFEMDDDGRVNDGLPQGICSTPLTGEMIDAAVRLLECLESPLDSRIFGPQSMRDIIHLALYGEQGGALRALADKNSRFSRIAGVLRRMHSDYDKEPDIRSLAEEAGMGISAFRRNFKAVTSLSPLHYLEKIRLQKRLHPDG
jgi:hypothetical protein